MKSLNDVARMLLIDPFNSFKRTKSTRQYIFRSLKRQEKKFSDWKGIVKIPYRSIASFPFVNWNFEFYKHWCNLWHKKDWNFKFILWKCNLLLSATLTLLEIKSWHLENNYMKCITFVDVVRWIGDGKCVLPRHQTSWESFTLTRAV